MPKHDPDAVVYRYAGAKDGRYRAGVPRRDLTAADIARMPLHVLRDVTGGDKPIYTAAQSKAAKAARADLDAAPETPAAKATSPEPAKES